MSNTRNNPVSNPHFDEELEISDSEIEISQVNDEQDDDSQRQSESQSKFYASTYNSFDKKYKLPVSEEDPVTAGFQDEDPSQGLDTTNPFSPSYEMTDEGVNESEKESHRPRASRSRNVETNPSSEKGFSDDLNKLLDFTKQFTPSDVELEPKLMPFIPELIPAIGDIDAFITVPTPDQKPSVLGYAILDEPGTQQSDPAVVDLQLRAFSKASTNVPQQIRTLDSTFISKDKRPLEAWINNMKDLHTQKPAASVHYKRRMPDLEELMQQWPPEFEERLSDISLPSAELDIPLSAYCRLLALSLDIPCGDTEASKQKSQKSSNQTIEAMHVLLSLYNEFKTSDHFKSVPPL